MAAASPDAPRATPVTPPYPPGPARHAPGTWTDGPLHPRERLHYGDPTGNTAAANVDRGRRRHRPRRR